LIKKYELSAVHLFKPTPFVGNLFLDSISFDKLTPVRNRRFFPNIQLLQVFSSEMFYALSLKKVGKNLEQRLLSIRLF